MPEINKNIFSKNLKALRLEFGKTQDEMAQLLGITRARLANYEIGARLPDTNMLTLIAQKAGVSTEFLLRGGPRFRTTLNDDELKSYTRANEKLKKYGDYINLNEINLASRIAITQFFDYLKEAEEKEKTSATKHSDD